MKIPTIYGLSLILVAFVLALMFHFYRQNQTQILARDLTPQNIRFANITGNSFTITWFTTSPTVGTVVYGNSASLGSSLGDDRDNTPQPRQTHFVTLTNLTPQSTYYFKIRNDTFYFPQQPLTLSTPASLPPSENRPLTGTFSLATNPELIDTLIFLQTDTGNDLATYLDPNLNYLLPLNTLRRQDLSSIIDLSTHPLSGTLLASNGIKSSFITLPLPYQNPLPTLTLGQNLQLDSTTAPNSANLLPIVQSNLSPNPSPF